MFAITLRVGGTDLKYRQMSRVYFANIQAFDIFRPLHLKIKLVYVVFKFEF